MLKLLIIALLTVAGIFLLLFLSFFINYKMRFGKRVNGEHDTLQKDFPELLYEKGKVRSSEAELTTFLYHGNNSRTDKLLVFAHGVGVTHRSYLYEICHLVSKGYQVLAFDYTGCGESGGKTMVGFPQWIVDLENILTVIENDERFKGMEIHLVGHSFGAYAVTAVMNNVHKRVSSVVALSGINSGREFFTMFDNIILKFIFGFYNICNTIYEDRKFGKIGEYTAVGGLDRSNVRALIYHSKDDKTAPWKVSISSKEKEINDKNAVFRTINGHGHMVTRIRGKKGSLDMEVMDDICDFLENKEKINDKK